MILIIQLGERCAIIWCCSLVLWYAMLYIYTVPRNFISIRSYLFHNDTAWFTHVTCSWVLPGQLRLVNYSKSKLKMKNNDFKAQFKELWLKSVKSCNKPKTHFFSQVLILRNLCKKMKILSQFDGKKNKKNWLLYILTSFDTNFHEK